MTGLPDLQLDGLQTADARALFMSALTGPIDPGVRDQIITETRGNPLALLGLARGSAPADVAGGFALPVRWGCRTAWSGDFAVGWTRSRRIPDDWCFSPRLIRSVSRPSCGARPSSSGSRPRPRRRPPRLRCSSSVPRCGFAIRWCAQPPGRVAVELERSAAHAQRRGGLAAAAALRERAAALTPGDPRGRLVCSPPPAPSATPARLTRQSTCCPRSRQTRSMSWVAPAAKRCRDRSPLISEADPRPRDRSRRRRAGSSRWPSAWRVRPTSRHHVSEPRPLLE